MRIVSWNVNGIRAATRKGFLDWLAAAQPDVLCLQEIKAMPEQLGPDLLSDHGYHVVWNPAKKKGYSGTATFSKVEPDAVQIGIGEDRFDDEGRILLTQHGDVTVINCYFPHGQRDHARLPYKTDFYRALFVWGQAMRAAGKKVCITGDWNTAHNDIDIRNYKSNRKTSGFTLPERQLVDEWVEAGWHDAFRALYPERGDMYTWWSQRGDVRARNVGWRIDYHFVADELWPRVQDALIHTQVMGSDHCPIELVLDEPALGESRD